MDLGCMPRSHNMIASALLDAAWAPTNMLSRMRSSASSSVNRSPLSSSCTTRMRETVAWAREVCGGNGIVLDYNVARFFADSEALYSYEGGSHGVLKMSAFANISVEKNDQLDCPEVREDILQFLQCCARLWFDTLVNGNPPSSREMESPANAARRRVHQGIALSSVLRAFRLGVRGPGAVVHRGRLVVWVPCIRGDTLVAGDRRFADCSVALVKATSDILAIGYRAPEPGTFRVGTVRR
jgi:hypothetical protein